MMKPIAKMEKPHYHFAKHVDEVVTDNLDTATITKETDFAVGKGDSVFTVKIIRVAKVVVNHGNIAKPVLEALLSKHHKVSTRLIVGAVMMGIGILIGKLAHVENELVAGTGECVGAAVHGLGLIPFIEYLVAKFDKEI